MTCFTGTGQSSRGAKAGPATVTTGYLGGSVMRSGELALRHQSDRQTLVAAGELDMTTAPELEAAVEEVVESGADQLLLDLEGLVFIDSTGLRAILAARKLCTTHGCDFRLTRGKPQVRRLFEITGALDLLPFVDAVPAAAPGPAAEAA